jgi:hypothetical protein
MAIPSVTEVIKFVNSKAFDMVPVLLLEAAAERGTLFHILAAAHAKNLWTATEVTPEVEGYFKSFTLWWKRAVVKVLLVETRLFHPVWKYHGTPDFVGIMRGSDDIVLLDWKLGVHDKGWRLQLAAYRELCRANDLTPQRVGVLQPDPSGKKIARLIDMTATMTEDFNVFRGALTVWRYFNE